MTDLTFADSHNMVAYLEKLEDNTDFAEIVDFLNASPIRYALTLSPTVYVSYIEQFWSTAKTKTINNETQIRAKVDGKTIVITESSVRRDLHFNDEDGITCLTSIEIFENLQLMGFLQLFLNNQIENLIALFNDEYDTPSHTKKVFANMRRKGKDFSGTVTPLFPSILAPQVVEGKGSGQPTEPQHIPTTASPSHVEPIPIVASSSQPKKTKKHRKTKRKATKISQSSGPTTLVANETVHEERSERVSIPSYDLPLPGVNTHGTDEERIELKELMDMCTKLSDRVLDLENVKNAQALEIQKLKKRVKKLESKKKSRTPQLKMRLFKVGIYFKRFTETQCPLTTAGVSVITALSPAKGVTMQEPSESGTRVRVPPPQIDPKDKGKAKMVEPKKPKKKKDQIEYDADVAQRLQAEGRLKNPGLKKEREVESNKAANIAEFEIIKSEVDRAVPELAAGSSKRDAEEELDQESSKRKKTEYISVSTKKGITLHASREEFHVSRGTLTLMLGTKRLVDQIKRCPENFYRKIITCRLKYQEDKGRIVGNKRLLSAVEVNAASYDCYYCCYSSYNYWLELLLLLQNEKSSRSYYYSKETLVLEKDK
ncbi:hypothetical protein Tco_0595641 [Tanacetum coccineum]